MIELLAADVGSFAARNAATPATDHSQPVTLESGIALYQSLAEDEGQTGLFRDYKPDFFDLIIVDECHRGSAQDGSNWRAILDYFKPAVQLGMTATPLRQENRDTYEYFGNPLYTYSLKQGIADGFLAPYRVHRVLTTYDAAGWRPTGYGRPTSARTSRETGNWPRACSPRPRRSRSTSQVLPPASDPPAR